ncbi:hypothetical protein COB55_02985 [Candidatus Wolfebacteria bacterium]|nr:MAG: hypothetical protein COB55_02985 [Candidatus Wolfebacteria bacterium]
MLYFIHGTDVEKTRAKAHGIIDVLKKKKPDALFFRIDEGEMDEGTINDLIGGQGLFEKKYIVFLNTVCENAETKEILLKKLKEIQGSDNVFILLEGKLDAKTKSKIEKVAEKVQTYDADKKPIEKFNIFSLTDALGKRNRRELWVLYHKARLRGSAPEEIHGILFWQIKTMLLAAQSANANEAGLKPFVYGKATGFLSYYSLDELKKLSQDLVVLYHNARRGIGMLDTSLERFVLTI